jgi:hypothetical protein
VFALIFLRNSLKHLSDESVGSVVAFFSTRRFFRLVLAGGSLISVCGLVGSAGLRAAEPVGNWEVLIYADGDRVRGKLVERSDGVLIFQSEKFGLLRVPVSEATVEKGDRSAVVKAPGSAAAAKPAVAAGKKAGADRAKPEDGEKEQTGGWAQFSPFALTQAVREYFGPWHGRIAFSTEIANDVTDRTNTTAEVRLKRKWSNDEVEGIARYDFAQSAEVTTKDVARLSGLWRRDFPRKFFGVYRPTLEWNRASKRPNGASSDYFLVQQEIGAGLNVLATMDRKLRLGVSENYFDVWVTAPQSDRTSETSASTFAEVEWSLPWRIQLTERGVWYPPFKNKLNGWENRIELNKKLTETLSVALRHETRQNNPDERVRDYSLLRMLVGLDF